MLTMLSFLLIDAKFVDSCMKPSVAIQHIVLTFYFLFFMGQKYAVNVGKNQASSLHCCYMFCKWFLPFD